MSGVPISPVRVYDQSVHRDLEQILVHRSAEDRDLLARMGSCAPYLASLIRKSPDLPLPPVDQITIVAGSGASDLRDAKHRVALQLAACDLAGAAPVLDTTRVLSTFAANAVQSALSTALGEFHARGKLPGLSDADLGTRPGIVVFAMGKMGAAELNYSSDIDLVCLFDETRFPADQYLEMRNGYVRVVRRMVSLLSDVTGDGYVFRTDLRLRPDPSVTPVCLPMDAAERYYASLGRTWERAAWIKAHPCAGDIAAGEAFLKTMRPFVWRRHLDYAAIADAHDLRLAIRKQIGRGQGITLPAHNMKLGRGGIREIEFFTQTRQLIAGGRDPELRSRRTVDALAALAAKGWVAPDTAQTLTDHYLFYRQVEHRLQMVHDAQTHRLPSSDAEFERLACMMGQDVAGLKDDLARRLTETHAIAEDFFTPDSGSPAKTYAIPEMDGWKTLPSFRSGRARDIFERLRPALERKFLSADRPSEAVAAFGRFLAGLPAGVQVLSLFEANPALIDLLTDIVMLSPALADYLARHAHVLDAVIAGDFFANFPGVKELDQQAAARIDREQDYERALAAARIWTKEQQFRIGVHLLQGLVTAEQAGRFYADVAGATLRALYPHVEADMTRRHGPPPGRGAVVVGMGSLGAGRLHARSDLDMIVIYDAGQVDMSEGPRPLPARTYYARFTQTLITALTAPMGEGRIYEIDMRLRPSGNKGPVATSLKAFETYQMSEAWAWEHLALTRARPVAGPADLRRSFDALRAQVLIRFSRDELRAALADMRARLLEAKGVGEGLQPKLGRGRMQDIELLSQAGALLAGDATGEIDAAMAALVRTSLVAAHDVSQLKRSYRTFWTLQALLQLLSIDPEAPIPAAAAAFVASRAGAEDETALRAMLDSLAAQAGRIIDAALQEERPDAQGG